VEGYVVTPGNALLAKLSDMQEQIQTREERIEALRCRLGALANNLAGRAIVDCTLSETTAKLRMARCSIGGDLQVDAIARQRWCAYPLGLTLPMAEAVAVWERARRMERDGARIGVGHDVLLLWSRRNHSRNDLGVSVSPLGFIQIAWHTPAPEMAILTRLAWKPTLDATGMLTRRMMETLLGRPLDALAPVEPSSGLHD
jgi:hypothetical protein